MAVQAGPTFKRYAATGVATVYTIPFLLLDAADLQITLNGVPVTTGFTLSGVGNPTSTCTFTAAPTGDLLFQLMIPFQRLTDYQTNGDFLAVTVNKDFDRTWQGIKQLSRDSGRALTVSALEPEGIPGLPVVSVRMNKLLAFDASGYPVASNLTLAQVEAQPAQAAAAAQTAIAAASAASGSATTAAGYSAAAQAWANTPVDTVVTGGLYSALHWATKAADQATAAANSASSAAATLAGAVQKTGAQTMAGPLTITNGLVGAPITKEFLSAQQAIASNGSITLAHGIGAAPKLVYMCIECVIAEQGWSTGQIIGFENVLFNASAAYGLTYGFDATNIVVRFGAATNVFNIYNAAGGGIVALTNANWRLRMRVWG